MGSETGGGGGNKSGGLVKDRERHIDARTELGKRGSGGQQGTSIGKATSRGFSDRSTNAGQGAEGSLINPIIINQAPTPAVNPSNPNTSPPADTGTSGQGTQGRSGGTPQRSLLTLGLAETARKTLLGL